MAKFFMCAVRDQAVQAFNTPMCFRSKEEAIRSFGDAVRDPKNVDFGKHAEDYSIWALGEWDDNGTISPIEPVCLLKAVDVSLP